jgi:hypothetical protein
MTTAGNRSYTVLDVDVASAKAAGLSAPVGQTLLGRFAIRFQTDVRGIWIATSANARKFKGSTFDWFSENVEAGDTLEIPFPGDDLEWRVSPVGASSLAQLCEQDKAKPNPLRIGGPVLTPNLLYSHIVNEAFRKQYLSRVDGNTARLNIENNPATLPLEKTDELYLPFPVRRKVTAVAAAPSDGRATSATVAVPPSWIVQYYDLLCAIERKADELAPINKTCAKWQDEGLQAWGHTMVLHELVRLQQRSTSGDMRAGLDTLELKVDALEQCAKDVLFVKLLDTMDPGITKRRKQVSDDLVDLISLDRPAQRAGELSRRELEAKLTKSPFERVNHDELLIGKKDRALTKALLALAASPRSETAMDIVENVLSDFEKAPDIGNTDTSLQSTIGGMTTVASATVGNLPGPSSLGVVAVWCKANMEVSKAFAAAKNPSAAANPAGTLLKLVTKAGNLTQEKADLLSKAISTADPKAVGDAAALLEPLEAKRGEIASMVADNFMVGRGWTVGVGVVSLIALINTLVTPDQNAARKAVNVLGGGLATTVAALQFVAGLTKGGGMRAALGAAGKAFSVFGLLASVLSGAITLLTTDDSVERIASGAQTAGSALLLLGYFSTGPAGMIIVAVGGAVIVGGAIYGSKDAIARRLSVGPKVILRDQLDRFVNRMIVKVNVSPLKASVDNVLSQLEAPLDSGLHSFRSGTVEARLSVLGFSADDISLMTSVFSHALSP